MNQRTLKEVYYKMAVVHQMLTDQTTEAQGKLDNCEGEPMPDHDYSALDAKVGKVQSITERLEGLMSELETTYK